MGDDVVDNSNIMMIFKQGSQGSENKYNFYKSLFSSAIFVTLHLKPIPRWCLLKSHSGGVIQFCMTLDFLRTTNDRILKLSQDMH